jgi:hypothetical protein
MNRFILVFVAGLAFASTSTYAARCDGDFQLVRGSWVATPYCRAAQIASVAREFGINVSAAAILNNPGRREEICRFLESDFRVHPACEQVHPIWEWSR